MEVVKSEMGRKLLELSNGNKVVIVAQGNLSITAGIHNGNNSDVIGSFDFNFIDDDNGGFYKLTHMFLDQIPGYTNQGLGRKCLILAKEYTDSPIFCGLSTGEEAEDGSHLTGNGDGFASKMIDEGIISGQI